MMECPYCGVETEAEARFCDRCGERLSFESESRAGFLRRSSIQYLQGVRHGARPLDPSRVHHEQLCADLGAAVEDFSHLAAIDALDLSATIDVDETDLLALQPDVSPDTDLRERDRRTLGLAVLVELLESSFDGRTLDELQARTIRDEE